MWILGNSWPSGGAESLAKGVQKEKLKNIVTSENWTYYLAKIMNPLNH